jgi:hypothetical protein
MSTPLGAWPAAQVPTWQVLASVHASPSSQEMPSATAVFEHAPLAGSNASSVQRLPSLQFFPAHVRLVTSAR